MANLSSQASKINLLNVSVVFSLCREFFGSNAPIVTYAIGCYNLSTLLAEFNCSPTSCTLLYKRWECGYSLIISVLLVSLLWHFPHAVVLLKPS
jgi:hypothetical protein